MRKSTATLGLTLTLFLGSVGMSAGVDFQKSVAAFKSEDYATAPRGLKPLLNKECPVLSSFWVWRMAEDEAF